MSSTAEENFLRNRESRAKARAAAAGNVTNDDEDKILLERHAAVVSEIERLIQSIESTVASGNLVEAKTLLQHLRRLVQDAAATQTLTAYEMSRGNNSVSRLQALIQAADEAADAMISGTGDAAAKGEKGDKKKRFKFSSSSKRNHEPSGDASPTEKEQTNGAAPEEGSSSAAKVFYGPASGSNLFIPSARALFVQECDHCSIFVLPIAGSAFITKCHSCKIFVACHQLRLKDCTDVEVYCLVASTPIIESCNDMRFGPYLCWKGLLQHPIPLPPHMDKGPHATKVYTSHLQCVKELGEFGDEQKAAEAQRVDDFHWLKKSPSPHWRILDASEYASGEEVFE